MKRLSPDLSFSQGVQKLTLAAMEDLRLESRVHEARVAVKHIRAWLRLLRPVLGEDAYARENAAFRDIGRLFRESRDARVLCETIDGLRRSPVEGIDPGIFDAVTAAASKLSDTAEHDLDDAFVRMRSDVAAARQRLADLDLGDGEGGLKAAFRRSWRSNLDGLRRAIRKPTAIRLHEWRKSVKHLRHQIKAVRDAWPGHLGKLDASLKVLASRLGEDHDLSELAQFVDGSLDIGEMARGLLLPVIDERRKSLQDEIFILAEGIYDRTPRAFARDLRQQWRGFREG